jgi:hypothetical protein
MLIISNQILIDFIRLNQRADDIRNQELGKQLDEIIIGLGGTQRGEVPNGRENEEGNAFGFPKTSMTYNFPQSHLADLFSNIFSKIK